MVSLTFGIVGLLNSKIAQGMDYWRLLVPLVHMSHLGYSAWCIRLGNDLPTFGGEPPKVLIFSEPFAATHGDERRTLKLCRKLGMLYVVDIADDPTRTDDSPMQRSDALWEAKLECISEADLVTCPTEAMAQILRNTNDHVEVVPDLAEAAHWDGPRPPDRPSHLTIGVRGGATHGADWAILEYVWLTLAERYPDVHFVSAGLQVPWMKNLPEDRYHHLGWTLIDRYQEALKWIDIGCVPLADLAFNKSKSPIAFYDFTLAGAVTIAQRNSIYDYPLAHRRGVLAQEPRAWIELLSALIERPVWRRELHANALDWVKEYGCMNATRASDRYSVYARHWERVYGEPVSVPAGGGVSKHQPVS